MAKRNTKPTDRKTALLDAWDRIEIAKRQFSIELRKLLPIGAEITASWFVRDTKKIEKFPATVTNHSDGGDVVVQVDEAIGKRLSAIDKLEGYEDRAVVNFHQISFGK